MLKIRTNDEEMKAKWFRKLSKLLKDDKNLIEIY